jgi:hypothetical protein
MSTNPESPLPHDSPDSDDAPRSIYDLREIRDLELSETSGKRVQLPPPPKPSEARKTTPLPGPEEVRPAPPASDAPASARAITEDEYKKIRARLRADFIVVPKRLLRNAGAIVGGVLVILGLMGFVTARIAGRSAALSFMNTQLGDMVKRNEQDLDLETREALARSREAADAAIDAHQQAALILDQLKRQLGLVEPLAARVTKVEQALQAEK